MSSSLKDFSGIQEKVDLMLNMLDAVEIDLQWGQMHRRKGNTAVVFFFLKFSVNFFFVDLR